VQPKDTSGLGTWAENGDDRGKRVKAFRLMAAVGPPDSGTCTPFSDVHSRVLHRLLVRKAEHLCLVCAGFSSRLKRHPYGLLNNGPKSSFPQGKELWCLSQVK